MKMTLIALVAVAMTACTSTNILTAPEQAAVAGIEKGDAITLYMTDGTTAKARFVAIEGGDIIYDDRAGERRRAELGAVRSLDYRTYDAEKTGAVVGGTAAVAGAVLLGMIQVVGAFAGGY